ncbi:MAG: hypothetical protein ACPGSI_16435 [Pikeienuella sp.]
MLAQRGADHIQCGSDHIYRERAANFARAITQDLTAKEAGQRLHCHYRVIEDLRAGTYLPGELLMTRWQQKFHPHFDRAIRGEDSEIAVRKARIAALIGEIRELRGK